MWRRAREVVLLDRLVEPGGGPEPRRTLGEDEVVGQPVRLVHQRAAPSRARPRCRRDRARVARVELVRVEPARRVATVGEERPLRAVLELPGQRRPVGREGVGERQDPVDVGGRQRVARQVGAPEAHAPGDRDLLRGELEEERLALVRPACRLLDHREELVGDDAAGDRVLVEEASHRPRQDVHVGEDRQLDPVEPHPAQQLVPLPAVVAELRDHEVGPDPGLEVELEVLEDDLGLEALERRDRRPQVEPRGVGLAIRPRLVDEVVVEREEAHRVDVEHGLRQAAGPLHRMVPGDGEDVADPARLELPGERAERVAAPVAAGDVDDDVLPAGEQLLGKGHGARHRVAAGAVGDRDRGDPGIVGERARGGEAPLGGRVEGEPPGGHDLGDGHELVGLDEARAEGLLGRHG